MKGQGIIRRVVSLLLRTALVAALFAAGWSLYSRLPNAVSHEPQTPNGETVLQVVLRPSASTKTVLEIPIELYPIDIVSVRDEYFTERRAGKRFDDFLSERMKGRATVAAKLDKDGQTTVLLSPGDWWLHALLSDGEELEWRLPIKVSGKKQTVELTAQNAYTRTRSF